MSLSPGRPKTGSVPPGGTARSAREQSTCLSPGRPKTGSVLPEENAGSTREQHT
jgi:hypothetical protein